MFPSNKLTINGTPLIEWNYDDQVADYETSFECNVIDFSGGGAKQIRKASLKV